MRRAFPALAFATLLGGGLGAGRLAAQTCGAVAQRAEQALVCAAGVTVTPVDRVRVEVEEPDGSRLIAGQLVSEEPGCAPGGRAYVERLDPGGATVWQRVAGVPAPGQAPLFGAGGIDPAFLGTSSVHDLVTAPDGSLYAAGEATVMWTAVDGSVRRTQGAFLVHLAADGTPLAERLLAGRPPGGFVEPPPPCSSPCDLAEDPTLPEVAARALALDGAGDVVVTGWLRPPEASGSGFRRLLLAELTADLAELHWSKVVAGDGDTEGLDVAVDTGGGGQLFVTGYSGAAHDAFLSRHGAQGALLDVTTGGGPCYDEGQEVAVGPSSVTMGGFFVGQAVFDGETLDGGGEERSGFTAEYDKATLRLLAVHKLQAVPIGAALPFAPLPGLPSLPLTMDAAVTAAPGDTGAKRVGATEPGGLPMGDLGDSQPVLTAVDVLVGKLAAGGKGDLVTAGDGKELEVKGVQLSPQDTFLTAKVRLTFTVQAMAPHLVSMAVKAASEHCTTAHLALGGGALGDDGDRFFPLGSAELPAGEDSLIEVEVPAAANEALGFATSSSPIPDLLVDVTFEFDSICLKPGIACESAPAEDGSMDQITVTSDY